MRKCDLPWSKDGIEYDANDVVKIWCDDCNGCNKCCENMSDTVVLDPYDIWQFSHKLKIAGGGKVSFELLISEDGPLELGSAHGVILPHMKMVATDREDVGACPFLNEEGRCSIHFCRPGICRLYPLARNYSYNEETATEEMGYFILNESLGCHIQDTTDVSIKDWLGIDEHEKYQEFLLKWHGVRDKIKNVVNEGIIDNEAMTLLQSRMLAIFFEKPYGQDFFAEFDERLKYWESL